MRILLTGGSGQLGMALRRTLAGFGAVIAPTRAVLDLASADAIIAAVRDVRPDLIINAGAYTAVDQAESEAELAMLVNGLAPRVLADEAKRLNIPVIHYSTDYVFDGAKTAPYVEDDEPAPLNVYGRTKLAGELGVMASGAACLIVRTTWVYASYGRNFLLTMRRLGKEGQEIKVVDDQRGAPTFAPQIAEATATMIAGAIMNESIVNESIVNGSIVNGTIDMDRFRAIGGLYHLTASGQTTWYGFAQAILAGTDALGRLAPTTTDAFKTPAHRPLNAVLDNGKFARQFGFRLPDWRIGLARCLAEISAP
jgi:dTDP-4-dehydrorhamnose reductase